eukprot:2799590-Amphidinium_carterae.1
MGKPQMSINLAAALVSEHGALVLKRKESDSQTLQHMSVGSKTESLHEVGFDMGYPDTHAPDASVDT